MEVQELDIPGVLLITPRVYKDSRGSFLESYKDSAFRQVGINFTFGQDNQSVSGRNVLRGLHFQNPPFEQGKLVRVVSGAATDVIVDIRRDSATYGRHLKIELDASNMRILWIPPGFAHGFVSRSDQTVFLYKCTKEYDQASESGIRWDDPELGIDWQVTDPVISEKDAALPYFKELKTKF